MRISITLAAIGTLALLPATASAQYYYYPDNDRRENQVVGGLIGAGLGAVAGSQLAGSGARTEGSVLGAVVGGLAGAAIADGRRNRGYYGSQPYYNNGYYNQGYYNQGFYQQPRYYNSGYYSYSQPTVRYNSYYTQPRFNYYQPRRFYGHNYYRPRNGVSISFNNGFRSQPYRYRHYYQPQRTYPFRTHYSHY